jgi:ATP-binding protein involved in chromosome partitioning
MKYRFIVPVISGKGGVGKSTVAANLAVSLAARGYKVALVDGDFYGPSIPTLFGGGKVVPNHEGKLLPDFKYGVKYISLGFFLANPDDAVIWRGPMFNKALNQIFSDVEWGEVDICVVDMPPGTGDAQISLAQLLKISGAVVVTTPQEVALADVRKAISMLIKLKIPILGIVENMSYFLTPDNSKQYLFGQGGGKELAIKLSLPLLAEIPLQSEIREAGDCGKPLASTLDSEASRIFDQLASQVISRLEELESYQEPQLEIVN